ncbi:hypothetical protein ACFLYY_00050 [Patescibacteria group bacterium]
MQQTYVVISLVVLAIVAAIMFFTKKVRPKLKLSTLSAFAFIFILTGIVFGENLMLGYSLMGVGVILAFIDIFKKLKK